MIATLLLWRTEAMAFRLVLAGYHTITQFLIVFLAMHRPREEQLRILRACAQLMCAASATLALAGLYLLTTSPSDEVRQLRFVGWFMVVTYSAVLVVGVVLCWSKASRQNG